MRRTQCCIIKQLQDYTEKKSYDFFKKWFSIHLHAEIPVCSKQNHLLSLPYDFDAFL